MRTALVTGGSGPIGSAIGGALAAQGCRVVLLGRSLPRLEAAAARVGAEPLVADLLDPAAGSAIEALRPDILVHSAAAYAPYGLLAEGDPASWSAVFALGPLMAMSLCKAVIPAMTARAFGRIVLVSSLAASTGAHGQAAYASAKAAYLGLARSLALEVGRAGITVNVLELGLVDTPRVREVVSPELREAIARGSAVGRAAQPEEIASVAAWLCSEGASYVTGAVIPATGGLGLGLPRPP